MQQITGSIFTVVFKAVSSSLELQCEKGDHRPVQVFRFSTTDPRTSGSVMSFRFQSLHRHRGEKMTYRFAVGVMNRRDDPTNHDEAPGLVQVLSGFLCKSDTTSRSSSIKQTLTTKDTTAP